MVQSHIMNVLPRRLLANLWASQETRISLSNLTVAATQLSKHDTRTHNNHYPAAASPSFLCSELPVRYTHILRLLSTLHDNALQTPLVRNAAQRYLVDICTLLHPSLLQTSPQSFSNKIHMLRQRQSQSLIWLRYALTSSSTATSHSMMLMDHINVISLSIHLLLDQHVAWSNGTNNQAQMLCPLEIAHQAVADARKTCGDTYGNSAIVPEVSIKESLDPVQEQDLKVTHIPSILHRVLYESSLLVLRSHCNQALNLPTTSTGSTPSGWLKRHYQRVFRSLHQQPTPLQLDVFGGPTSIGYRLTSSSSATLSHHDLQHDIPRDPLGLPACSSVLRQSTHQQHISTLTSSQLQDDQDQDLEHSEWFMWSGWRAAKAMAGYFGGHLDVVSSEGLGSTMYIAFDRDCHSLERYPSALFQHPSSSHQHRHLSLRRASSELDALLFAIAAPNNSNHAVSYTPATHHHHAVSLTAAVGHA